MLLDAFLLGVTLTALVMGFGWWRQERESSANWQKEAEDLQHALVKTLRDELYRSDAELVQVRERYEEFLIKTLDNTDTERVETRQVLDALQLDIRRPRPDET